MRQEARRDAWQGGSRVQQALSSRLPLSPVKGCIILINQSGKAMGMAINGTALGASWNLEESVGYGFKFVLETHFPYSIPYSPSLSEIPRSTGNKFNLK